MTTLALESATASPLGHSSCAIARAAEVSEAIGAESGSSRAVDDVVRQLVALPLRARIAAVRAVVSDVFEAVNASVVEWGDDGELAHESVTVDEELAGLQAERGALVGVLCDVVALTRSLDASARVLADQHARVVSRFDVLDADQVERRLSSPATALAGEFACDDFAPLLGMSPATAARWAECGSALRSRHPRLLRLAGAGVVRMRACEVVASELAHLEPEDIGRVEAEFLSGDAVRGSEASIRKQLRRLLDHHGLSRPRDEGDQDSRIALGFNEFPECPTLTELNVVMPADEAWKLNAAIEARAGELVDAWHDAHGARDGGYPLHRARVDALLDLALGNVRFVPDVRISVPVTVARSVAEPQRREPLPPPAVRAPWSVQRVEDARSASGQLLGRFASAVRANRFAGAKSGLNATCVGERVGLTADCDASACRITRDGVAGVDTTLTGATATHGGSVLGGVARSRSGAIAHQVADLDVPHIGRVSADALVALAETLGAHVTVALADAATGVTAWTSATTYRPGAGIRRHVVARDEHCRFPGCMRPAPMCDVDHVVAHTEGGSTSPANLQLLCRHHHRAKTHGAWAVAMASDGTCVWQSPVDQWFRTHPGDATAHRITEREGLAIAGQARAASQPIAA